MRWGRFSYSLCIKPGITAKHRYSNGTDVLVNLTDPGWCRTDLGGPHAPNAPETAIPGIVVGVFVDDRKSGRYLGAQEFAGMALEDAVKKAEAEFDSPYGH